MQLAIGLLIFSWIMLLAVVGFTFRDARNRRALTQKIKTLEASRCWNSRSRSNRNGSVPSSCCAISCRSG